MIVLCGLSSWDTPTPVQCVVLCSRLTDWLSSTVVYAQAHRLIVLGPNLGSTCSGAFLGHQSSCKTAGKTASSVKRVNRNRNRHRGGTPPPPTISTPGPTRGDGRSLASDSRRVATRPPLMVVHASTCEDRCVPHLGQPHMSDHYGPRHGPDSAPRLRAGLRTGGCTNQKNVEARHRADPRRGGAGACNARRGANAVRPPEPRAGTAVKVVCRHARPEHQWRVRT